MADTRTVYVVVHQPEYEEGHILMVCEDPDDASHFARQTRDPYAVVQEALFVPAGARSSVYQQQVWTLTVSVEPGGDGLWYPGAVRSQSELQWLVEDPPAEATVETVGRAAISKPDKYVVRATGSTPHTANTALQDKLTVLLRQLEDGTLDTPAEQLRRAEEAAER